MAQNISINHNHLNFFAALEGEINNPSMDDESDDMPENIPKLTDDDSSDDDTYIDEAACPGRVMDVGLDSQWSMGSTVRKEDWYPCSTMMCTTNRPTCAAWPWETLV